jgi:hypothetical protein
MANGNTTPMSSMAASAKGKLQDWMKSWEDAYRAPTPKSTSSIEVAFRNLFGVCTNGAAMDLRSPPSQDLEGSSASSSSNNKKRLKRKNSSSVSEPLKVDFGEHIYAQLFFDDQLRAARAVETTTPCTQGSQQLPHKRSFPKPFPMSSPLRSQSTPSYLHTPELHIPTHSFDDGISAISAHTLEAMDSHHTNKGFSKSRSNDSSIFSTLPRNRSKQSQSTRTTESSHSVWQREEQKYWQDMVVQDEGHYYHPHEPRRRSPRRSHVNDSFVVPLDATDMGEI